jgi:lipopolysaccharide biosynthesis glycosyltransferase/predicted Zn-dependent protease
VAFRQFACRDWNDDNFMSGLTEQGSVAAFFSEGRVQAAVSGPRSAVASALTDEFFTTFQYADCSPDQLLTLSDLATKGRNQAAAAGALRELIARGAKRHLAHYRLGRMKLAQKDYAEAAEQFDLGIAAHAEFPFNHMGAARARHAMGSAADAVPFAERFAGFGVRPHGNDDLAVLAELADRLFDEGHGGRARPIYELVSTFGGPQTRSVVRLADARMAEGDYAGARDMLLAHVARHGADPWIDRALARGLSHLGDHRAAIAHAASAMRASPGNPGFVATFVRAVGKSADASIIEDAMAQHEAALAAADIVELKARLFSARADLDAASEVLLAMPPAIESRLFYTGVEIAYAALAAGLYGTASSLGAMLAAAAPDDVTAKVLRIDILFRQLKWEEAGDILATMQPAEGERPQVTMKRLEYACFTADSSAAAEAARSLEAAGHRQLMQPVLRFYAEQQDWRGVVDRALPWLDRSLNYGQIGYVLFRAAKHTGRQAEMRAVIEAVPDWRDSEGLLTLRNNLACDMAASVADIDFLLDDPAIGGDAALRQKLQIRRDVLAPVADMPDRTAVFLCTDANYLCATMVALHGLALAPARHTDFYVVADDDVAGLAEEAAQSFRAAGINLTIMRATDVVGSAERLFPAYGLFTSGHKLASAAYYRIYFAKYLRKLGLYARALYVDGDVLLTGTLDAVLRLDCGGMPIAARLETSRPDVRRAIDHHGFAPGQYFNSGVLLLDFSHPDLEAALDASVHAIADTGIRLLYHDQCALNLGFRDRFAPLSMAWNFPVEEATRLADIPADTFLLHFLGRPKPWSAAYGGEAGPRWFAAWRDAARFLGEDIAIRLFREIRD